MKNLMTFFEVRSSLRMILYLGLCLSMLYCKTALAQQQQDTVCVGAYYPDFYIGDGSSYISDPYCTIDSYSETGNVSDVPSGMYYSGGYLGGTPTQVGTYYPSSEFEVYSSWCWNPSGTPDYNVYWNTWATSPTIIYVVIDTFKNLSVENATVCLGMWTTLNLIACNANFSNTYIWEKSTDGGITWSNIAGATGISYTTPSLFASTTYRVLVSNPANGSGMSNPVTVNVNSGGSITISTQDSVICMGDTLKLTPIAIGVASNSIINWQGSSDGISWSNVGFGGISSPYIEPTILGYSYYRAVIQFPGNGCNMLVSNTQSFDVGSATLSSTTPTICTGGTATITLNSGTSSSAYTWQQSTNGGTSWYSVTGTTPTTNSITTGVMTASRMFRVIYNSTSCGTQTTPTFTLNVVPDPVVTVTASNNNFCAGGNTTLSASLSGGIGTGVYQWQKYIGTTWTNITGETAANYTTAAISANTNYKVLASQTGAGCVATGINTANIIVKTLPNIYTNPDSATILNGNSVTLNAYNGTSYSWSPAVGLNTTTGATVIASPSTSTIYAVTGTGTNGCSKTIYLPITVNYSTDIEQNSIANISIFPNPADRNIRISMNMPFSQAISFCISDILGKTLTQWEGKPKNGIYENEISIENLSQGVYFLSVKIGERVMIQKFVKE